MPDTHVIVGGARPSARRSGGGCARKRVAATIASTLMGVIVLVAWFSGDHDGWTTAGFLTGMTVAVLVLVGIAWWARRRGGSSYSRALDGTVDERDKAIWQGAWAVTGKVAWFVPLVGLVLHLLDREVGLGTATTVALWINLITLFSARFWLDRRM